MIIIDPGHDYRLDVIDGCLPVFLVFVKREGEKYPGNIGTHPGTIIQEVCRVLIDRMKYVNAQQPCPETEACIKLTREIIYTLESRAARVHNRVLRADTHCIENEIPCKKCGHIGHECKEIN